MITDRLAEELEAEIHRMPLIDVHTHIDPRQPTARSFDEILSYHYYTELAHSVGMGKESLAADADPRERVRSILYHSSQFDNTMTFQWLLEIARAFLGFQGERLTIGDATWLCDRADRLMSKPNWEKTVLEHSHLEKIFLTNEFDDPLEGFDTNRYVPCLRADDLVFRLHEAATRQRLSRATQLEVGSARKCKDALAALFERFLKRGAKACAISLPPGFKPAPMDEQQLNTSLDALALAENQGAAAKPDDALSGAVIWLLAQMCDAYQLPFDLMIGVNRRVYPGGVHQGQDLFDQRTSLIDYAPLFNAFPRVSFCVSVLSSTQNQELVAFSWIFPNVYTSGHWWYSNVPAFIEPDLRARLQAVPKTKQIGYYSDMYKLEFGLPKFNMYRRMLAQVLADRFVRPRFYTELQALEMARLLLHDNARRIFGV